MECALSRDLFQSLDTDGSGGICLPELMDGLKRLGYVVTQVALVVRIAPLFDGLTPLITAQQALTVHFDWRPPSLWGWSASRSLPLP